MKYEKAWQLNFFQKISDAKKWLQNCPTVECISMKCDSTLETEQHSFLPT